MNKLIKNEEWYEKLVEDVQIHLGKRLAATIIGDPAKEGVRMGALAGKTQLKEVLEKIELLFLEASKELTEDLSKNYGIN